MNFYHSVLLQAIICKAVGRVYMLDATCAHPTEKFLVYPHNHKHLYLTFRCNAFLLSLSQRYTDKVGTITSFFKWEILKPKFPSNKVQFTTQSLEQALYNAMPLPQDTTRVLPVQPLPLIHVQRHRADCKVHRIWAQKPSFKSTTSPPY